MRTYLCLCVLVLSHLAAKAQENNSYLIKAKVKHGSVLIGGNLNAAVYTSTNELANPATPEKGTTILANLNFKSAYFIRHDFALGIDLGLNHESTSTTVEQEKEKYRATAVLAGPLVRYYFDNGVFGEFTAKAGLLSLSSGDRTDRFEGTVGVGYALFLNERIAIEPLLSFRYAREWRGELANTRLGPVLGVGVQAYLLRRSSQTIKEGL